MHISNCTMFNWCKRFKKLHADGLVCLSWTFWRISLSFSQFFFGFILFINYLYSLGKFCSASFILYFFLRKFNAFHFVLIKTAWYNIQRIHKYSLSFRLPVQILKKIICQWLLKSLYVSYQLLLLHGSFAGGENFTKLNVTIY